MSSWKTSREVFALALLSLGACQRQKPPSQPPQAQQPAAASPQAPLSATAPSTEAERAIEVPAIFSYDMPEVIGARVRRRGRWMTARMSWRPIAGHHRYHVQVSRTVLFTRPAVEAEVRAPQFLAKRIRPGAYFWRVRVVGAFGESRFSPAQRLEAPPSRKGERRNKTKHIQQEPWEQTPEPDVPVVAAAPLHLKWATPAHRSVVKTPRIELVGRATSGARLIVNSGRPVVVNGPFRIPVTLVHGRNELTVEAELGEQNRSLSRDIYYADPRRLGPVRDRFEAVKKELDEISKLRRELAQMIKDLRNQANSMPAGGAKKVEAELKKIQAARTDLDTEVSRVIAELDRLLAG